MTQHRINDQMTIPSATPPLSQKTHKMFHKMSIIVMVVMLFLSITLTVIVLVATYFFPVDDDDEDGRYGRVPIIKIVPCQGEKLPLVIVDFGDPPPCSHSTLKSIEYYDDESKEIVIREYVMFFHPFSRSVYSEPMIVMTRFQDECGEYKVYYGKYKTFMGILRISENTIEWYAAPVQKSFQENE